MEEILNSGAWSLFQSNIKRDLYIKKLFWLGLSHFHMVEISVCTALVCGSWMEGYPLTCALLWEHFTPWSKSTNGEQDSIQTISNVCRPALIVSYYNEDWIRRVGVWVNSSGRSEWAQNIQCHLTFISTKNPTSAPHMHVTFPVSAHRDNCVRPSKQRRNSIPKTFPWVSKLRGINTVAKAEVLQFSAGTKTKKI